MGNMRATPTPNESPTLNSEPGTYTQATERTNRPDSENDSLGKEPVESSSTEKTEALEETGDLSDVSEPVPESMPEPLSTRDIEQIVVPQSFYTPTSVDESESANTTTNDQIAAFKPVDPTISVPSDLSESPESIPEPLSTRDLEDISDHTVAKSDPNDSPQERNVKSQEDSSAVVHPLTVRKQSVAPPAPHPPPLPQPQPPPLSKPPPHRSAPSHTPLPRLPPLPRPSEQPGVSGPPIVPMAMPPVNPRVAENLGRAMITRLTNSDFDGALIAANTLLRSNPRLTDALQAAQIARSELYKIYDSRLGDRNFIPCIIVPTEDIRLFPIDTRGALVLSRIDGTRTIDEIIHSGILPKLDALRVLSELHLLGVISIQDGTEPRS